MKIAIFCDRLVKICLYLLAFAMPIFFLPFGFEFLEFNKQNLLIVLTLIAGLAWLGKMIAEKRVVFRKSFLNLLVLLYLVIYTFAAIFSADKYRSFVGALSLEKDGLITVFCFVLLYFIILNNVREVKTVKNLIYSLLLSAGFAAIFAFLGFLGFLPKEILPSSAINTVGTLSSFGIFLSAAFILASVFLLKTEEEVIVSKKTLIVKTLVKTLLFFLIVFTLFLLIAIDVWMVWTSFMVGLALFLAFAIVRAHEIKNLAWLSLPLAALAVAILLFFIRTPINFNLPIEIMPSLSVSAKISKQTLQEMPLLGSGPGTFVFDWAKYKPQGINLTPLWNVKFDRSVSRILTMLATTGLLGLVSWLFLIFFLAIRAFVALIKEKAGPLLIYNLGIVSVWFLLLVAKFIYSSNLTLEFLFWFITALVVIFASRNFWEISLETSPRASLLLSFLLTLGIIFSISTFYLLGQRFAAEIKFSQALAASAQGEEPQKVSDYLKQAVILNRWNDDYFRNLAQSLLTEINQELNLEPTEERARKVQNLIAIDIDVAKRATELSPKNSSNWSTLASIYATIMPIVSGADEWAVNSWQKAIELEPTNPIFYTEFGKAYIGIADLHVPFLQAEDEKVKQEAETKIKENLAKAEEQFNKAIELKNDYAPAHFQLALVYGRQGKIKEAISKLEAMKANLPNDVGVAFQLGLLYWQNKEQDKAIAELERALKLVPNFANAHWYLAAIYEEQGKKDLAIAELEEILKTNPENETVKKKIESLKAPPPAQPAPLPEPIPEPEKKP